MKKRIFFDALLLRKARMRSLCPALALGALIFFLGACPAKAQDASRTALANAFGRAGLPLLARAADPVDFSLPLAASGEQATLSAYKGKVVFLNFWATWCGPCRAEMPSMEVLYRQYKEKGFEILAVNCMEKENDVLAFMGNNRLSFPAILDADGRVSGSYGIQAIPTTFLLDREGKIIARMMGSRDWDTPEIRAALELLLENSA